MDKAAKPVRCKKCGRFLFKVSEEKPWEVEIKCPKCGYIQTLNGAKKSIDILYKRNKMAQHIERFDRQ